MFIAGVIILSIVAILAFVAVIFAARAAWREDPKKFIIPAIILLIVVLIGLGIYLVASG